MTELGRCRTCVHWSEGAQDSLSPSGTPSGRGNCQAIGEVESFREQTDLALANNGDGTVSSWLETRAEFGCVLHVEKPS